MARQSAWVLAAVLAVGLVRPAAAQERPRPGAGQGGRSPVLMLAAQKSVQEELKLSDEQVKQVAKILGTMKEKAADLTETDPKERMKKAMEMFQEAEKGVFAVLKPEQAKRLRQIALQQQHLTRAVESPEVAKELQLSEEQVMQARAIREGAAKAMSKLSEDVKSRDELREKTAELAKATEEKLLRVLTEAQKTKWKEMLGEPFKGEIKPGFGLREREES
jgi:hypothetical protein